MLKRIVVPLDGSPCAQHAFDYALRLAKAEGDTIDVCSVIDPVKILGRTPIEPFEEEPIVAAKARAEEDIKKAVEKAAAAGIAVEGHVELGEPAPTIVAHARKVEAESIVMGTHGRSGFKRLFMGSVAEEVLRTSPCPVVIVREKVSLERNGPPPPGIDRTKPVYMMRLIEVAPENFDRLYDDIAKFMQGAGNEIPGILEMEILGSEDLRRIAIVVHFRSHEDWVHAQWDARVGKLVEEVGSKSKTLEFNLFRGSHFPGKTLMAQA